MSAYGKQKMRCIETQGAKNLQHAKNLSMINDEGQQGAVVHCLQKKT
jgi:hypothetical protein